jgi:hypothetical protein
MTLHVTRRHARSIGLLGILTICCGCEQRPRLVTVTGSVVRAGQPMAVSNTGYVQVMLLPDVGADENYTTRVGRCEKDGTFKITEVPPGKYKIGIEQFDPNPQIDKLNGAFRAGDSKIVVNIDGKAPLNLDLAKPKLGQ